MFKYFYHIETGINKTHNYVAVVDQYFWNKEFCLSSNRVGFTPMLYKTIESLNGYEYLQSIFRVPVTVSEKELVEALSKQNIYFETNSNFSDFVADSVRNYILLSENSI